MLKFAVALLNSTSLKTQDQLFVPYVDFIPKPVKWAEPGVGAPGIDRAISPTATINLEGIGEQNIDVTQDVEMWYTGIAPNHGWVMAIDEANTFLRLYTPLYNGRGKFRLRITYEPE